MAKNIKKSVKVAPLSDRVLIKPISEEEAERKTDTGIIIPATVSDKKEGERGTVIAIGPGKLDESGKRMPMDVKKGDTVLFQWGDKVTLDGEEYYIVSENNILAILG